MSWFQHHFITICHMEYESLDRGWLPCLLNSPRMFNPTVVDKLSCIVNRSLKLVLEPAEAADNHLPFVPVLGHLIGADWLMIFDLLGVGWSRGPHQFLSVWLFPPPQWRGLDVLQSVGFILLLIVDGRTLIHPFQALLLALMDLRCFIWKPIITSWMLQQDVVWSQLVPFSHSLFQSPLESVSSCWKTQQHTSLFSLFLQSRFVHKCPGYCHSPPGESDIYTFMKVKRLPETHVADAALLRAKVIMLYVSGVSFTYVFTLTLP